MDACNIGTLLKSVGFGRKRRRKDMEGDEGRIFRKDLKFDKLFSCDL